MADPKIEKLIDEILGEKSDAKDDKKCEKGDKDDKKGKKKFPFQKKDKKDLKEDDEWDDDPQGEWDDGPPDAAGPVDDTGDDSTIDHSELDADQLWTELMEQFGYQFGNADDLVKLVQALNPDYRDLDDFFQDNPGVFEGVVQWVEEHFSKTPEWQESVREYLKGG